MYKDWIEDGVLENAIEGKDKDFVIVHGGHPSVAMEYIYDLAKVTGKAVKERYGEFENTIKKESGGLFQISERQSIYVFNLNRKEVEQAVDIILADNPLPLDNIFILTDNYIDSEIRVINMKIDPIISWMKAKPHHSSNVFQYVLDEGRMNLGSEASLMSMAETLDPEWIKQLGMIEQVDDLAGMFMYAHTRGDFNSTWIVLTELARRREGGFKILSRLYEHYRLRLIIMTTDRKTAQSIAHTTGYPEWLITQWNDELEMTAETCEKLLNVTLKALRHVHRGRLTSLQALCYVNVEIDTMGIKVIK